MSTVKIIEAKPYFNFPVTTPPRYTKEDYAERILLLREQMALSGVDICVIYADREHFANIDYLTGFEPRYEEALLVLPLDGELTLLVGNECLAYSYISPVEMKRVLYQNFSLQGQPRDRLIPLSDILLEAGIRSTSSIGVIGFKWFSPEQMRDAATRVDIPAYIIDEMTQITPRERIVNFTHVLTRLDGGIRMKLNSVKEIAWYEHACSITSDRIIEMTHDLTLGISERALSKGFDGTPTSCFPLINFGSENIATVLGSPDETVLLEGDPVLLDYGVRGSLTCRAGVAVQDEAVMRSYYGEALEDFFKPYFKALAAWYETIEIGGSCADSYQAVKNVFGSWEDFGVLLNPGHCIATDEWTNSPFFSDSPYKIESGWYIQSDVIASRDNPVRLAIMEDGLIVADRQMREELKALYPEVYERTQLRRNMVRNLIGINLSEDVLPLSNCQAVYHPFMLDRGKIFAMQK